MTAVHFLEIVVSLSLQAALLLAIVGWLANRTESHFARDRLWAACHLTLLLMTVAGATLPHFRLFVPADALDASQLLQAASVGTWLGRVAFACWCVGAGMHLILLAASSCRTVLLFRKCRPVSDEVAHACGLATGDGGRIHLLCGPDVPGPLCWQWQRSVIVVPESLLSFPVDELRAVVSHEVAHLRFGHPLQLFLQRLVGALYWFHPAVWWALRRAAADREFLCDAKSVSSRDDVAAYLRSLIRLAELGLVESRPFTGATGLSWGGGRRSLMADRAAHLSRPGALRQTTKCHRQLSGLVLAMGVLLACGWIPLDPFSSERSHWSPWPRLTADVLHVLDIPARDYEVDAQLLHPHELREHVHPDHPADGTSRAGIRGTAAIE